MTAKVRQFPCGRGEEAHGRGPCAACRARRPNPPPPPPPKRYGPVIHVPLPIPKPEIVMNVAIHETSGYGSTSMLVARRADGSAVLTVFGGGKWNAFALELSADSAGALALLLLGKEAP